MITTTTSLCKIQNCVFSLFTFNYRVRNTFKRTLRIIVPKGRQLNSNKLQNCYGIIISASWISAKDTCCFELTRRPHFPTDYVYLTGALYIALTRANIERQYTFKTISTLKNLPSYAILKYLTRLEVMYWIPNHQYCMAITGKLFIL